MLSAAGCVVPAVVVGVGASEGVVVAGSAEAGTGSVAGGVSADGSVGVAVAGVVVTGASGAGVVEAGVDDGAGFAVATCFAGGVEPVFAAGRWLVTAGVAGVTGSTIEPPLDATICVMASLGKWTVSFPPPCRATLCGRPAPAAATWRTGSSTGVTAIPGFRIRWCLTCTWTLPPTCAGMLTAGTGCGTVTLIGLVAGFAGGGFKAATGAGAGDVIVSSGRQR